MHWIAHAAAWYAVTTAHLVWLLLRLEWWLLHCRPFVAAAISCDLILYVIRPLMRRMTCVWREYPATAGEG